MPGGGSHIGLGINDLDCHMPKIPPKIPLYPIVKQHLATLRDELQHHETALPRFVLTEFQDYLHCDQLEYGLVRVKCNRCRHEHLVAFSCKRRGFCPSCGARRMIETSARAPAS